MILSKILSWGKEVLTFPSPNFSNTFFPILVLQCHFFVHLLNSTVDYTGTDAARLVDGHHLEDLGLHVILLENSRNLVGPVLVYSQLVFCRNN